MSSKLCPIKHSDIHFFHFIKEESSVIAYITQHDSLVVSFYLFSLIKLAIMLFFSSFWMFDFTLSITYRSTHVNRQRDREMFYLTTHSTHFIYGYMASDIWLRTILIVRKESRCRHIGYSYRLTARVLLYAPSHRQDNTYHGLRYTSRGALVGTRNSSMGPAHVKSTQVVHLCYPIDIMAATNWNNLQIYPCKKHEGGTFMLSNPHHDSYKLE